MVIPGALRDLTDGQRTLELTPAGATLRAAMAELHRSWPAVYERIMTETGQVRTHVNLFVGDTEIRYMSGLDTGIEQGDEIVVLPAVSGG